MKQDIEVRKQQEPVVIFKNQIAKNEHEFRAALPAHIPAERFARILTTAVINNPALLEADRRSLFDAAIKAAQDGLLPDGREGALVIFGKKVQWMPMTAGLLKKIRNSGELLSIAAHVAYSNDDFTYELGDEEKIHHKPALEARGKPRLVYAIAKTKDGGIYREIMTMGDIEKVRAISRAANSGPWVSWFDEMARKTVLRRLSKRLPMSSDLDDLLRRDDHIYDSERARLGHHFNRTLAESQAERLKIDLDALANGDNGGEPEPPHDHETGEIISDEMAAAAQAKAAEASAAHEAALNDPTGEKAAALLAKQLAENGQRPPYQRSEPLDLGTQRLLNDAHTKAKEGSQQFKRWIDRLGQKHFDQLAPYLDDLRAEANAVGT